ncbi:hypothetical protein Ahy_A02g005639 [Arachis hypogaea]|uniref:Glycosyl hydrolase family 32 N-terminal domain-containing protein n=1 Tax=Arachis hypogaea TaxID=3818 RepID=A0A445E7H3_ARAHY|nr:hypothetical protein Ahy_A02g005639 [Arachis hypogaea]
MGLPKCLNFLILAWSLYVICNKKNGVEGLHKIYPQLQSISAPSVGTLHQTGYHFQPPRNWINAPMYYKGLYHLFYQYNPKGSVWGNIVWGHSVSRDLINWKVLEPALYPDKPFDRYGVWSGSATVVPGRGPIILYTGVIDERSNEVQCYAVPANASDPFLTKWVKPDDYNPIAIIEQGVNGSAFRDPTTAWWIDGHWKMLVGAKKKHRGEAYLYNSKDFVNWVRAKHPIHSAPNTGMWECPDLYPVSLRSKKGLDTSIVGNSVKHVLKNSLDVTRYDYYTVGTYLWKKDKYIPDNTSEDGWGGLRYDYGNFYASKSFFDPSKNRRIIWGWANESDSTEDDVKKGWAGIQADVEVTFSFSSLNKAEPFDPSWVNAQDLCAQKGSKIQGGVGPFGLLTLASKRLEEFTPVFFRIFKAPNKHVILMCSDASSSSLANELYKPSFAGFVDVNLANKKLSLRSLIDHSVVESFGAGGRTNILSRVYPTLAVDNHAHLFVFNNGTEKITVKSLKAWSMRSANIN